MAMFNKGGLKTVVAAPAAKKSAAPEVNFGKDFDALVLLLTFQKFITSTAKLQRNLLDSVSIVPYLYETGMAQRKKPANPKVVGDLKVSDGPNAGEPLNFASVQFIKKDNRTNLQDDAVELMSTHGIPYEIHEVKPGGYEVNKKYLDDDRVLTRANELLDGAEGIPEDFIVQVDREVRRIVSDRTHDAIFALDPKVVGEDTIKQLLAHTTTLKVVPKSKCSDPYQMIEYLRTLGVDLVMNEEE